MVGWRGLEESTRKRVDSRRGSTPHIGISSSSDGHATLRAVWLNNSFGRVALSAMAPGVSPSSRTGNVARHIPTMVAIGAVTLYGLGIVATAGQLRSAGLDVVQGMRLIPIEVHLRNGAGILVAPTFLLVVGLFLFVYVVTRATTQAPLPPPHSTLSRYVRLWEGRVYPMFLIGLLTVIALIAPWPAAASFALVIGSWFAVPHLQRYLGDAWKNRRTALYVLLVFGRPRDDSGRRRILLCRSAPKCARRDDCRDGLRRVDRVGQWLSLSRAITRWRDLSSYSGGHDRKSHCPA